ncbi:MAG TPA: ATP-dependent Clp protease adapter ClpS [Deltaproteobacteria bacterium]|nr:ATP-dependent Clp protease adapter ClpS [Deltaproteobacteria bacterium]
MSDRTRRQDQEKEDVLTRDRVEEPKKFKVILLNDDYTTMEFVVWVLVNVFHHTQAQATRIMLHIHNQGVGVAGIYSREVAETRVAQVEQVAKDAGHPLQCIMEPE